MRVFRPGAPALLLAACAVFCASEAWAQTQTMPAGNPPAAASQTPDQQTPPLPGGQPPERPLTPEEQRQKEIDKYDPLRKPEPAKPVGSAGGSAVPAPSGAPRSDQQPRETPLPGSVADSNQAPAGSTGEGPQVADDSGSGTTQPWNGPAVLSRSYTIERPMTPRDVKWSWTIGSAESYQNGLVGQTAVAGTAATSGDAFGTVSTFTLSGRHLWKKDQFGLSYSAGYSDYIGASAYNGLNQRLSIDYEHQFARHILLNLVETGSILSANYAFENPLTAPGVSVANLSLSASPAFQLLDQSTRQFQTTANVTWQKSSRLSFNLGGGFFAVGLSGPELTSNVGYQAQADVNYRYTSRTTVGVYYSYTYYLFTKHESLSDTNTGGLIYSYAFDRRTQLRVRAGISRIESLSYTQIPINPIFAVLLGESSGIVDIYGLHYTSDISAQFLKDLGRRRTVNVSYARGVAPGNGLILTSVQQVVSAGFAATIFRRYTVNLTGGRTSLTSQAQSTGSYTTDYASLGVSRNLPHGVSANASVSYTHYTVTGMPELRSQFRITTGISWSPGPGRLW